MKIAINPGHTIKGKGTGASGILVETEENRKIARKVMSLLRMEEHQVIDCTIDESENDLKDAVDKANRNNVDLFCSIHLNAGGGHGTETYVYKKGEVSEKIAKRVNDNVAMSCDFRNRGVKEGNFYVLRNSNAPAILVEVCFVDSEEDSKKINIDRVADAIVAGLLNKEYEYSELFSFSKRRLKKAGWYEGRNLDVQDIREVLKDRNLEFFESAEKFLREFRDLEISFKDPAIQFDRFENHDFDFEYAIGYSDKEYFEEIEYKFNIGESVLPVGNIDDREMILLITPSNKFYIFRDDILFYLGNKSTDVINYICRMKMAKEIELDGDKAYYGLPFKVRRSWEDVYSQIASSLYVETSKEIADKNPGYNVYNLKGELVYSPINISYK